MKINSIQQNSYNYTNFKGQFKKTSTLETLLISSNNKSRIKFLEIAEKASKVNDYKVFIVGSFIDYSKDTTNGQRYYEYFLKQKNDSETKIICSYNFGVKPYNYNLTEKRSAALNSFINKLSEIYLEKS